jgi:hypothetical protein
MNTTSKYNGVSFHKRNKKFVARVYENGNFHYLGYHDNEDDAARIVDETVIKLKLDYRLNFPDEQSLNLPPDKRAIYLTRGLYTIIDAEDYERVNAFKWYAKQTSGSWYACRKTMCGTKNKYEDVQHFILGDYSKMIDHIDGDGLHNWKSNLRFCTSSENGMNQRVQKNRLTKSSIYKGVQFPKKSKKYLASIRKNSVVYNLGSFTNEIDAAKAYDKAAKEMFGEFANLNFPDHA